MIPSDTTGPDTTGPDPTVPEARVRDLRVGFHDRAELEQLTELARAAGLTAQEASAPTDELSPELEPVTMLLVGGGLLAAAKFLTDWMDHRRGGLVVDQRPGAADEIRRDGDVPWGMVLVFPSDGGRVRIQINDQPKDATERLLAEVVSGVHTSAEALAEAVRKVAGVGPGAVRSDADAGSGGAD